MRSETLRIVGTHPTAQAPDESVHEESGVPFAMTVQGPVDPDALGFTLMHEHLLFDTSAWLMEPADDRKRALAERLVEPKILEDLRRDPFINRDNLLMRDPDIAVTELGFFRAAGGGTVVDVTTADKQRDPVALREISRRAGVTVVMGTGYYTKPNHPPAVQNLTIDALTEWMIDEIRNGVGDTGIQPGVIGEIGLSGNIHPDEEKVLRAAGAASRETGLAISVHQPVPYEKNAGKALDILEEEKVELDRVIICHMSHSISDLDYHRSLVARGASLEYDRFGAEFYWESWPGGPFEDSEGKGGYREPRDSEVADAVAQLVREGYARQILLSHDIAFRIQLRSFGGHGFDHVAQHVLGYLLDRGATPEDVEEMTIHQPRRLLSVSC